MSRLRPLDHLEQMDEMRNPLTVTWRDTLPAMRYDDVAAIARRVWLMPLARAAGMRRIDPGLLPLYRPLGGSLLLRWLRDPALELSKQDPLALAAAHAMLRDWVEASAGDDSEVPHDRRRSERDEAARVVLIGELARHWDR